MTPPQPQFPPLPADGVQHQEKVCSCPIPSLHRFEPLPGSRWLPANTLTAGQEKGLQDLTLQIRRENEDYLVEHPEIEAMVQLFLQQLLEQKPRGGFLAKAVAFFTRPAEELQMDAQRFLTATKDKSEPSIISCRISDVYANPFPSCESMTSAATSNPATSDPVTSNIATSNLTASDPASPASPCSPPAPAAMVTFQRKVSLDLSQIQDGKLHKFGNIESKTVNLEENCLGILDKSKTLNFTNLGTYISRG